MGFFDGALSSLKDIVGGNGDHAAALDEAVQQAESNPEQLASLIGRFTNHPEFGDEVQGWMKNPQAQELLSHLHS